MGAALSLIRSGLDQSFNIPTPPLTEKNLPDQSGKAFLITGANTGVGYEVSRILYSVNGTVYLACRTESKAHAAIERIQAACPNSTGKLVYLHLDLSDLRTIKASAESFLSQSDRLDWLDNNAGVMFPPLGSKTVTGHDLQFGTNVLGSFLFTKLLLPILKSTASKTPAGESSVRVSWAGSLGVDVISPKGGIQFDPAGNVLDFNGAQKTYGSTKVGNWWLAYEFGRRHGTRDRVLHTAYNPGNLKTELQRHSKTIVAGVDLHLTDVASYLILFPSVMGAYTELYSGLSPELTLENDQGGYIVPWGRRTKWNRADVVVEMGEGGGSEKLWDWCEQETRQYS